MANQQFGTKKSNGTTNDLAIIAKIRIPDENAYTGEYAFDWIDIKEYNGRLRIEKMQGIGFEKIRYFMGPSSSDIDVKIEKENLELQDTYDQQINEFLNRLNNNPDIYKFKEILSVEGDEREQLLVDEILKRYPSILYVSRIPVDRPYILIKENQIIELKVELIPVNGELTPDKKIKITDNENYEFQIKEGEKKGNVSSFSLVNNQFTLQIKCLQYSDKEQPFYICLEDDEGMEDRIGGFIMLENIPLILRFRVIGLLTEKGNLENKARTLLEMYRDANVTTFLNNESLNQAGYKVEIENAEVIENPDSYDLSKYFVTFDENEWIEKGYFDGVTLKTDKIDYVVMDAYKKVLSGKEEDIYSGGLIILSGNNSDSNERTGAFSRTKPLNYYSVFMFMSNLSNPPTYAHEIGHMLGLKHIFLDNDDILNFENSKKVLINTLTSLKEEYKYYLEDQKKNKGKKMVDQTWRIISLVSKNYVKKDSLKKSIEESNKWFKEIKKDYDKLATTEYSNYKWNKKVVSKSTYRANCIETSTRFATYIENNEKVLEQLNSMTETEISDIQFRAKLSIINKYYVVFLIEYIEYLEYLLKELRQDESNYFYFKEKEVSKNLMDYSKKRNFFLANQIRVMRNDYKNY